MTKGPAIGVADVGATLYAEHGFMRMLLTGALKDANLWQTSTGANPETRAHWARRGKVIRELLDQLPAPRNPRDPFDDIPGEPMPEEADRIWREKAAAEDAREAARKAGRAPRAVSEDDEIDLLADDPIVEAWVEGERQERARILADDDMGDLLATPATRYFYHPESDCLMKTEDGSHPGTDGLVEEIDEFEYERLERRGKPSVGEGLDDDMEDLLG